LYTINGAVFEAENSTKRRKMKKNKPYKRIARSSKCREKIVKFNI
jgi:hypothetical protein